LLASGRFVRLPAGTLSLRPSFGVVVSTTPFLTNFLPHEPFPPPGVPAHLSCFLSSEGLFKKDPFPHYSPFWAGYNCSPSPPSFQSPFSPSVMFLFVFFAISLLYVLLTIRIIGSTFLPSSFFYRPVFRSQMLQNNSSLPSFSVSFASLVEEEELYYLALLLTTPSLAEKSHRYYIYPFFFATTFSFASSSEAHSPFFPFGVFQARAASRILISPPSLFGPPQFFFFPLGRPPSPYSDPPQSFPWKMVSPPHAPPRISPFLIPPLPSGFFFSHYQQIRKGELVFPPPIQLLFSMIGS